VPPRKSPRASACDCGLPWCEDTVPAPADTPENASPSPSLNGHAPAGSESGHLLARILPGGIILDEPETPPAVWGDGEAVLWAEGEALIIAGPDGVGKTTLAGCLMRARLGIGDGDVLGRAVTPGKHNVLYLAMDRPRQARRALRRLFTAEHRDTLDEKLRIWQGPPPADLARYPLQLAQLARLADADTIIIDSLKDAALKLSDDEAGSGWNRARQNAIEAGAELIELHHPRKAQADNRKPSKLEDLYGSRWITSGAGSVISLWGEPGDLVVEFTHLKSPAAQAGPWTMGIDPAAGTVHLEHAAVDLVQHVRDRGAAGATAVTAAQALFDCTAPDGSQQKKAAYRLNKKVAEGVLYRRDGQRGGGPDRVMTTWFLAAPDPPGNPETNPNPPAPEQSQKQSEPIRNPPADRQSQTRGDLSPRVSDCPLPRDEEAQPWLPGA
jgi:hypothetical protein